MDPQNILDRASILNQLRGSQGWKLILDWLSGKCDAAEFALISTQATDPLEIIALQRTARATRAVFDGVQQFIQAEIDNAERLLEAQRAEAQTPQEAIYG